MKIIGKALRKTWRVTFDAYNRFNRNDGWSMAGFIAFTGLLSIFPFMIFAATLTGILVGPGNSENIIEALFEIAPSRVALTLEPVVTDVLGKESGGEVLTLSAVFAIWAASNGIEAFRVAFDRAYSVIDPRGFFTNRALAIGMVFLGAIVAALLGISILLSPLLLSLAKDKAHLPVPGFAGYITYGFGIIVFVGFVQVMHHALPGRKLNSVRLWPGVIVTTALWVLAATGFSIYLTYTPTYTVYYGTLAGVIITLMFFYITGMAIIFGAEVNAALNRIDLPVIGQRRD